MNTLLESIGALPSFLSYLASALVLLALFIVIYIRVTPYREFALIAQGNAAAAISLSGAIIGFVLPLSSAIAHSISFGDMFAWAVVALVVQVVVYATASRAVSHFREGIEAGRVAPATLLAVLAIAVGLLNAACLTY